ncbi:hypothetical protein MNBD_PLANCTO02-3211 [hydrothermal vent metagenome]|uniref:VTC domain-containing protein n=1 Tax=hydrothermal vent metagenome TaxID=652676 RepID=A0A3B1DRM4_9ZZZZ
MISRYEIKFQITNEQKQRFVDAARVGLKPDPFGVNACYRVSSVYYDSSDLDFYWEKIDGESIRRKLRLRFYGVPKSPNQFDDQVFFLELKHRVKNSVGKERVQLTNEGALAILSDAHELDHLRKYVVKEDQSQNETISVMESLQSVMRFQAANTITYQREAWMGNVDPRLRLTFDQFPSVLSPNAYGKVGHRPGSPLIPAGDVIMEIKFNQSVPRWLRDIVAEQGLIPQRFSKYATGIDCLWQPLGRDISHQRAIRIPDSSEQNQQQRVFETINKEELKEVVFQ